MYEMEYPVRLVSTSITSHHISQKSVNLFRILNGECKDITVVCIRLHFRHFSQMKGECLMWRLSISKAKFQNLITGCMLLKLLCNFNFQLHKALFTEGHKWTFSYIQYTSVDIQYKKLQKLYVQINITLLMPSLHTTHKSNWQVKHSLNSCWSLCERLSLIRYIHCALTNLLLVQQMWHGAFTLCKYNLCIKHRSHMEYLITLFQQFVLLYSNF
jgi:hypothetical protein